MKEGTRKREHEVKTLQSHGAEGNHVKMYPHIAGSSGDSEDRSPIFRVAGSRCSEKNLPLLSTCIQPAFLTASKVLKERELRQHIPPCVKVKSDSVKTRKLPIVRSQAGQAVACDRLGVGGSYFQGRQTWFPEELASLLLPLVS